ncbi:hypothetical protein B0H15DRAFT_315843 [Mycena belliarum]|uniref:RBR-type E3 ubiquitin transferase n=1 Tax=Mycena belliarum TaxID=1033014 RepID=A0AAD6XYM4_9AGAR|nr:hypothetical protein B0H15DRAFT_315843 [Mycena belliae]
MSELEVLESIFPDFISTNQPHQPDKFESFLKLEIPIDLGEPYTVVLVDDVTDSNVATLSLTSLPPLLLHVVLSAAYPSQGPPAVTVRAHHSWLPTPLLWRLQAILRGMWTPGEGVLYEWVEIIRGGDFLGSLDLKSSRVIQIKHPSPQLLGPLLVSYDDSTRSANFSQGSYPCAICLTSIKGSKCLQLSCIHIFCRSCLLDYWSLCITEGNIEKLGCPDPECIKMGRESSEEEIARVVSEQAVQRWRWLKQKFMFEKDPSLTHCPMMFCQSPVPKPPDSESDAGIDRLRICPACSFSFCGFCKRTWHGAVQECPISHAETVVLEYLALAEDSSERHVMELRFGRTMLRKLVARYQEEQLNKKWLAASTVACPGCSVNIEKNLGCNHMTCSRGCGTHFCYRCAAKLNPSDPYKHFSTPGQPCFSKLFDFVSEDHEWQPF